MHAIYILELKYANNIFHFELKIGIIFFIKND